MIQPESKLAIIDNTGAKVAQVIKILGGSKRRYAKVGDRVVVSIKQAAVKTIVPKKSIQIAVIVRQKFNLKRPDGSYLRFHDNAAVIIDSKTNNAPKGTRIFGPIARELREDYQKIVSQAPEVL